MIIENLNAAKECYSSALASNKKAQPIIKTMNDLTSEVIRIFNEITNQETKLKALNQLIQGNQFINLSDNWSKEWEKLEKISFDLSKIDEGDRKLNEAISLFNNMSSSASNYKEIANFLKSVKALRDEVKEGLNASQDSIKQLQKDKDQYNKRFDVIKVVHTKYLEMVKNKNTQNQTSLFSATAKQQSQTVGKQTSAPEQPKNSAPSIKKVT
jgi:DNA repair ATPase RecN